MKTQAASGARAPTLPLFSWLSYLALVGRTSAICHRSKTKRRRRATSTPARSRVQRAPARRRWAPPADPSTLTAASANDLPRSPNLRTLVRSSYPTPTSSSTVPSSRPHQPGVSSPAATRPPRASPPRPSPAASSVRIRVSVSAACAGNTPTPARRNRTQVILQRRRGRVATSRLRQTRTARFHWHPCCHATAPLASSQLRCTTNKLRPPPDACHPWMSARASRQQHAYPPSPRRVCSSSGAARTCQAIHRAPRKRTRVFASGCHSSRGDCAGPFNSPRKRTLPRRWGAMASISERSHRDPCEPPSSGSCAAPRARNRLFVSHEGFARAAPIPV
ncbi:hypothetical protein B0H17DRAFT_494653 [Mycena rosella]|uniref:Uncharacterized protein n=1 Tax=Mycena rosella TaxID=1033263 RepID=A0AAD7FU83_MYCRO|nr:hypothetical protein B0H17DRAFT_494653 [Mycena rosella]